MTDEGAQRAQRFVLREGVLVERIDGACLVVDLEQNVYFGLNPVGLAIWESLCADASIERAVTALHARVAGQGVSRAQISADVEAFLAQLEASGLGQRVASSREGAL